MRFDTARALMTGRRMAPPLHRTKTDAQHQRNEQRTHADLQPLRNLPPTNADLQPLRNLPPTNVGVQLLRNPQLTHSELQQLGTSGPAAMAVVPEVVAPYRWIVHPAVDLFLCCGGLMWVLFAVHYFVAAPLNQLELLQMMALSGIIGTHLLGETHIGATLVRIFGTHASRQKFHPYTTTAVAIFALLGLAGLLIPGVTPVLTRVYLIWVIQHFTAQSYGIALLYCYKWKYNLSNADKFVLRSLLNATCLFAVCRQLTFKEFSANGFLAQNVPFWGPLPQWLFSTVTFALVACACLFGAMLLKNLVTQKRMMPLPAVLTVVTAVAIFVANRDQTSILFLYFPAFYHGSQYVVLSLAIYLKEKGLPPGVPAHEIYRACTSLDGFKYIGLLLLLACLIYVGLPRFLEEVGFNYTLSFATIFLVFNLHHFVTDMAIWKLRDPATRKLLVY